MKKRIDTVEDDFWTERLPFFTAQFSSYYTKPQKVHGRFHTSEENYSLSAHEIIPISEKHGKRSYVFMQPYVYEPYFNFTVKLYDKPKHYHDQESPIGQVIRSQQNGFQEVSIGSAQAWYYPADKTIVLWECFFHSRFYKHPFATDTNMQNLWQSFERYLVQKFPKAETLATPFNDPIAESIKEYQAFLKILGYSPIAEAAYGNKKLDYRVFINPRAAEGWAYYPGSAWWNPLFVSGYEFETPIPLITPEGAKPFPPTGYRMLDARTSFFYGITGITPGMAMRLPGLGSQYLFAYVDARKEYFDGAKTYKVTLPKDIPAVNFWSLTVYDNQTRSMLDTPQRYPRAGSQSFPSPAAEPDADGSTTVYFSPTQPAGIKRGNWIQDQRAHAPAGPESA
jgi:hypothetical protein